MRSTEDQEYRRLNNENLGKTKNIEDSNNENLGKIKNTEVSNIKI